MSIQVNEQLEEQLYHALAEDDPGQFVTLCSDWIHDLCRLLARETQRGSEPAQLAAADLAQDIMASILEKWQSFRERMLSKSCPIRAYLGTMIRNRRTDKWRSKSVRDRELKPTSLFVDTGEGPQMLPVADASQEQHDDDEQCTQLLQSIEQLSQVKYRVMLKLSVLGEGLEEQVSFSEEELEWQPDPQTFEDSAPVHELLIQLREAQRDVEFSFSQTWLAEAFGMQNNSMLMNTWFHRAREQLARIRSEGHVA